jgi:uncharacterized protein (DUF1501 family)
MMDQPRFDRRRALLGGLSVFGGLALVSSRAHGAVRLFASPPLGPRAAPRTLLLLQLSGGNDGLSTLVPYGDDAYHSARPTLRLPADRLLKLDDYRALHPELGRLRKLFDAGQLAIVQGAGYPRPVRSHFKSMDIWHTADLRGRAAEEGWVGRLCGCAWADAQAPDLVVHVGANVPYSLHSSAHPPTSFVTPVSYRWAGSEREVEAYGEAGAMDGAVEGEEANIELLRRTLADAQASSERIRRAAARYRSAVEYPADPFAAALRDVAALCNGGLGSRVFSVELGGFDTHTDQRNRHDALMRRLDAALDAFLDDLARSEAGRELVVLVFSEFGRRLKENGSRGTDHGVAAPMFVAGSAVKGGLYGKHPSLSELDEGDLRHTVDFRAVYAAIIEGWFGVRHEGVLGKRYEPLPLV